MGLINIVVDKFTAILKQQIVDDSNPPKALGTAANPIIIEVRNMVSPDGGTTWEPMKQPLQ